MKYIKITISLLIIGLTSFFVIKSLKNNQEDSAFTLVKLNEINNQDAFLWKEAIIDTSWIEVPISVNADAREISPNAQLKLIVSEYDEDNSKPILPEISLYVKDGTVTQINNNIITLSLNDIINLENGVLDIGIISNDEGLHNYDIDYRSETFNKIYEQHPNRKYELPVNQQLSSLKIIFIVFLIIILLCLACWFFLLKKEFFPACIDEGEIVFIENRTNDIYISSKSRKVFIGKPERSNMFKSFFVGKTQCELSHLSHQICIEAVKDNEIDEIRYNILCFPPTKIEKGELGYMFHRNSYKFVTGNDIIEFEYNNHFHKKN